MPGAALPRWNSPGSSGIRSLVQAIADGAPPKALLAELRDLEARQEHLAAQLSTRPAPPSPAIHPGMAKLYREQVARLSALVERPETRDEAMAAIRSLIEAVVLTPEASELRIDLRGDLADPGARRGGCKKARLREFRGRASRTSKAGCGGGIWL